MKMQWTYSLIPQGAFSLLSPPDTATNQPIDVDIDWEDSAYAASYDVYSGTTYPPVYFTTVTASIFNPPGLEYGKTYFWKIIAKNSCGEYESETWSFSTSAPPTYTISGTVSLGGTGLENVLLSGLPGDPLTDGSGYYETTVAHEWNGTAIPVLTCYSFTPGQRDYSNVSSNQTNQDYTAVVLTHTISGTVTTNYGFGLENVLLTGLPGDPATVSSGDYSVTVDCGWSGTVTPVLFGYIFSPENISYSGVTSDQTEQDYIAGISFNPPSN
jgi:hypothetical protein